MKRVTIWIFFIVFISIYFAQYSQYQHTPQAAITGMMGAVIVCAVVLTAWTICRLIRRTSSSASEKAKGAASNTIDKIKNIISEGTMHTIDNKYYAIAEQEIDNGNVDNGLWAKALVRAKGSDVARKSEYIKLRAKELQKK